MNDDSTQDNSGEDPTKDLPAETTETKVPCVEEKIVIVDATSQAPSAPRFLRPTAPVAKAPKAAEVKTIPSQPATAVDAVEALFDVANDPVLSPLALTLRRYANDMKPTTEVAPAVEARSQRLLYLTIMDILNREVPQEFRKLWQYLLAFAHHHRTDVFSPKSVFRGSSSWSGDNDSLDAFHSLLNLIIATADPATRANGLKSVSLPATLGRIKNESARNQVIAFYR